MRFADKLKDYKYFNDRVGIFCSKIEHDFEQINLKITAIKTVLTSAGYVDVSLVNSNREEPYKNRLYKYRIYSDGETIKSLSDSAKVFFKAFGTLSTMDDYDWAVLPDEFPKKVSSRKSIPANAQLDKEIDKELSDLWNRREFKS
jgi:hypothetical protein